MNGLKCPKTAVAGCDYKHMETIQPNELNPYQFLTPNQVASRWKWHPETIRRWTREGKLPLVKISRRSLIPLSAILAIEADGKI